MKERITWLDSIRTVAIFCVVLVHSLSSVYPMYTADFQSTGLGTRLFTYTGMAIGRLGVPLFLMLSGYLLLQRNYENSTPGGGILQFWKKNLVPLFLLTEVWFVFYYIFLTWAAPGTFTVSQLIKVMLFMRITPLSTTWYLPMIVGLYIFIPFVAIVLQRIDLKYLILPMVVVLVFDFVIPEVNLGITAFGGEALAPQLCLDFSGRIYGLYLIMGYLFYKKVFDRISIKWSVGVLVATSAVSIGYYLFINANGKYCTPAYNAVLTLVGAVSLFHIMRAVSGRRLQRLCINIARNSFGIYLIHRPIQKIIEMKKARYHINISNSELDAVLMLAATFLISWAVVELVSRVPVVGKRLFLKK